MVDFSKMSDEELRAFARGQTSSPDQGTARPDFSSMDDDQLRAFGRGEAIPEKATIGGALERGLDLTQSRFYRGLQGYAMSRGMEGAEYLAEKGAERNLEEAARSLNPERLLTWDEASGLSGVGRYALEQAALSAPGMAAGLVGGGIGTTLGGPAGGLLGAGLAAYPEIYGSNLQRQIDEYGEITDNAKAAQAAIGQTALEALFTPIPLGKVAGRFIGPGLLGPATRVGRAIDQNLVPRVVKGTLVSGLGEGGTEFGQQVLERWQAGLDLLDDEAYKEYKESFITGALIGGPIGGVSSIFTKPDADPNDPDVLRANAVAGRLAQDEEVRQLIDTLRASDNPEDQQKAVALESGLQETQLIAQQKLLQLEYKPGPSGVEENAKPLEEKDVRPVQTMEGAPAGTMSPDEVANWIDQNAGSLPRIQAITQSDDPPELKQRAIAQYISSSAFINDLRQIPDNPIDNVLIARQPRKLRGEVDTRALPGTPEQIADQFAQEAEARRARREELQAERQAAAAQAEQEAAARAAEAERRQAPTNALMEALQQFRQQTTEATLPVEEGPQATIDAAAQERARQLQGKPIAARRVAAREYIKNLPEGAQPYVPYLQELLDTSNTKDVVDYLKKQGSLLDFKDDQFVRRGPPSEAGPETRRPGPAPGVETRVPEPEGLPGPVRMPYQPTEGGRQVSPPLPITPPEVPAAPVAEAPVAIKPSEAAAPVVPAPPKVAKPKKSPEPEIAEDEEIDYDEHPLMKAHEDKTDEAVDSVYETENSSELRKLAKKMMRDGIIDEDGYSQMDEAIREAEREFKHEEGQSALEDAIREYADNKREDIEREIDDAVEEERLARKAAKGKPKRLAPEKMELREEDIAPAPELGFREEEAAKPEAAPAAPRTKEEGPKPTAEQVAERQETARKRLKEILAEIKKRGPSGRVFVNAFEQVLKDRNFTPAEVYHAYLVAETATSILRGTKAAPRVMFVKTIKDRETGKDRPFTAGLYFPTNEPGVRGLMEFALNDNVRKSLRQTGAHEPFHLLQDLIADSDPEMTRILFGKQVGLDENGRGIYEGGAFFDGMTLADVDPTVRNFLETHKPSENAPTYWQELIDREKSVGAGMSSQREMMAHVFGSLADARLRGISLGNVTPINKRMTNFLVEFKKRLASKLRGDGYRSIRDILDTYAEGKRQQGYGAEINFAGRPRGTDVRKTAPKKPSSVEAMQTRDEAFEDLARAQRDAPERAMEDAQDDLRTFPSGPTFGWALEHVGDLIHRMSANPDFNDDFGQGYVREKVATGLSLLRNSVDMERIRQIPDLPSVERYAEEHAKLPVYNRAQFHAREAAVSLGKRDFRQAERHLLALQKMIDDGTYKKVAGSYRERGRLKPEAMMVSEEAETFDPAMKEKAEQMEKAGVDPDVIWVETGLTRAPYDDKWRAEIPDTNAKITSAVEELDLSKIVKLGELMDHEALYRAYPFLKKIEVRSEPSFKSGEASFRPGIKSLGDSGAIKVSPVDVRSAASEPDRAVVLPEVLLHEIQHAVQEIEGTFGGAADSSAISDIAKSANEVAVRRVKQIERKAIEFVVDYIDRVGKQVIRDRADQVVREITKDDGAAVGIPALFSASNKLGRPEFFDAKGNLISNQALNSALMYDEVVGPILKARDAFLRASKAVGDIYDQVIENGNKVLRSNKYNPLNAAKRKHRIYRGSPGERESRMTEARLRMAAEELAKTRPDFSKAEFQNDMMIDILGGKPASILVPNHPNDPLRQYNKRIDDLRAKHLGKGTLEPEAMEVAETPEAKDVYIIHGGSDFDKIDRAFSGRGEPGNIRPLGPGLYGYVIDPSDPERAALSVMGAKNYSKKFGRGKKTLHVFKVPKSASFLFNGSKEIDTKRFPNYPPKIEGLGGPPQKEFAAYEEYIDRRDVKNDDIMADIAERRKLEKALFDATDVRMQHLPIGLTEAAINNPDAATPVGKFSIDADPDEIISSIAKDREASSGVEAMEVAEEPVKETAADRLGKRLDEIGFVPKAVITDVLGSKRPKYLDAVIKFMAKQRKKTISGKLTPRDILKAWFITVASQRAGAINPDIIFQKSGHRFPNEFLEENGSIRPEEAAAAWLETPAGQRALDSTVAGNPDMDAWEDGFAMRRAWGSDVFKNSNFVSSFPKLKAITDEVNAAKGNVNQITNAVQKLNGIATVKKEFLKYMLGFGDTPTIDAVEVNFWLTGKADISKLKNERAEFVRDINKSGSKEFMIGLIDRIQNQMKQMRSEIPALANIPEDFYYHVLHHWIWDKAKGSATTHKGSMRVMVEAMEVADEGGNPLSRAFVESMATTPTPKQVQNSNNVANQIKAKVLPAQVSGLKKIAHRLTALSDKVENLFSGFKDLEDKSELLRLRYRLIGDINKVTEQAKSLWKVLNSASAEQKRAVYKYLTTKGAAEPNVPPAIKAAAKKTKAMIGDISNQLLAKRLISQQEYDKWKDSYLPRLYMEYLEAPGAGGLIRGGLTPSDMGYLKKRLNLSPEMEIAKGKVTDPAFLSFAALLIPQRDMLLLDYMGDIAKRADKKWVLPSSMVEWRGAKVSPLWVATQAETVRKQAAVEPNDKRKALMEKVAGELQAIVDNYQNPDIPDGYVKMPSSSNYGPLAGVIVKKTIKDDIVGLRGPVADMNLFDKMFSQRGLIGRGTAAWKYSKTILSPSAQFRQFFSNFVMLHMSGVAFHRVPQRFVQAVLSYKNKDEYFKIGEKYGVGATGMVSQEVYSALDELEASLKLDAKIGAINIPALSFAFNKALSALKKAGKGAEFMYELGDNIFKLAKIIDEMEKSKDSGMSLKDREWAAAQQAHKWFLDYSEVPNWLKSARNNILGAPFLTYYYKVAPLMVEVMLKNPLKLLPYLTIHYGAYALAASAFGEDDDEIEKLRKVSADYLKDNPSALPLPYLDEDGRPQIVDVGYMFPWQMFTNIGMAIAKTAEGKGGLMDIASATGALSNPFLNLATAMTANTDPFTDQKIVNEFDPPAKQYQDRLAYVWNLAMPPWLSSKDSGSSPALQLLNLATGGERQLDRRGQPELSVSQLMARMVGINIYPVDPEYQRAQRISSMMYDITQTKMRLAYRLKNMDLSPEERREIAVEGAAEIRRRSEALAEFARETEIPESLRVRREK